MPAESFVGIWKFVARPNLCGTPRLREAATTLAATRATVYRKRLGDSNFKLYFSTINLEVAPDTKQGLKDGTVR